MREEELLVSKTCQKKEENKVSAPYIDCTRRRGKGEIMGCVELA